MKRLKPLLIIFISIALMQAVTGCGGGSGGGNGDTGSIARSAFTLTWKAPTTNADGTELTDLDGYMVYCSLSPDSFLHAFDVGNVTNYTVSNLEAGTYDCVVTAYDENDNESADSNAVTVTIGARG